MRALRCGGLGSSPTKTIHSIHSSTLPCYRGRYLQPDSKLGYGCMGSTHLAVASWGQYKAWATSDEGTYLWTMNNPVALCLVR